MDGSFLRGLSGRFSSEANISGEASSAVPEAPQSSVQHVPDVARFRCNPQVFRTRQAGSRQELRRRRRKFLRQCRLDANAQEKNKDGKDFRHGRYNDLKKNYLELTFKSF